MADHRSAEIRAAIHALPLIEGRALQPKVDYWATGNWYENAGERVRLKKHVKANTLWPGARGLAAIVTTENGDELVVGPREVIFAAKPPAGAFDQFKTGGAAEETAAAVDGDVGQNVRAGGPKP